jgi:purine-binding chemotaxis protein CheW
MERGNETQYLTFRCGEELFGVEILYVREIKGYSAPTTIPMMPRSVLGVINLRGNVLPIVDLNLRFGREKTKVTKRTCIVIIELQKENDSVSIGLLVDAVSEVVDIPLEEVEKAPSFGTKIRNDFIGGIGKMENQFVILLDINFVLSIDELSILEKEFPSSK